MANLVQSTAYTRIFFMYLNGQGTARVAATGKTVTVNLSKAGGTFGVAGGTVTEIANGAYKIVLTTTDTNTLGDLAFNCTASGSDQTDFVDQVGPVISNIIQINGSSTSGNNATLSLAQLNIVNSSGSAIVATSTGGNGNGLSISGSGSGSGLVATGGTTGNGISSVGGATSGHGIIANGTTSGHGIVGQAAGTTFHGVYGLGAGGGSGLAGLGNGAGHGLSVTAGITGHGISAVGGATNGNGITCTANGSGEGLTAIGVGNVSILATQGISGPLDAGERTNIADALLKRDMSAVTGEASKSPLNCFRFIRNKITNNGSTLTITKEDNTTTAWTSTITTNASAPPITSFSGN